MKKFSNLLGIALISLSFLATNLLAQTPAVAKPCQQIKEACVSAGFVKGEVKEGKGLWRDCVDPIIQGKADANAKIPLPKVDPSVVAACKQKHPKFGSGKVGI